MRPAVVFIRSRHPTWAPFRALACFSSSAPFSSGATAMTGIEAISNVVPAFKPVQWRNARITLSWMIGLLISMFAGILVVAKLSGVVPRGGETMLSQLAHLDFGNGPAYLCIQLATAAVLLMAANTSFNDFPRVLFLMARDQQAPRSFLHIGDRLTFSTGILLLSAASAVIYVVLHGNTAALLPLYAVGVFLAFTLSQAGMVDIGGATTTSLTGAAACSSTRRAPCCRASSLSLQPSQSSPQAHGLPSSLSD